MSTFAAIVLGTSLGGELFERWQRRPVAAWASCSSPSPSSASLTSFGIPRVPAAQPGQRFALESRSARSAAASRGSGPDRTLWMTVVGISYFWFLGALLQQVLLPWGQRVVRRRRSGRDAPLHVPRRSASAPAAWSAGRLSGDKVELGLVPLGSIGLGVFSLLLVADGAALLARGGRRSCCSASPAASSPCRSTRCSSSGRPTTRRAACSRRTTSSTRSACCSSAARLLAARRPAALLARARSSCIAGVFTLVVDRLHRLAAAGLLRPLHAVAADAHDLPHQDRRPPEHPARAARRSSSPITCR